MDKGSAIVFEQQSGLNKYVDSTIPLTWGVRWRMFAMFLPFLTCGFALAIEGTLLGQWLSDNDVLQNARQLLRVCMLGLMIIPASMELLLRLTHGQKRRLHLKQYGILMTDGSGRIPWDRVAEWRMSPVSGDADLRTLTVGYWRARKHKRLRRWSMVLKHPEQVDTLRAELEARRRDDGIALPLVELSDPLTLRRLPSAGRVGVFFSLSMICWINAFVLLSVGLDVGGDRPAPDTSPTLTHGQMQHANIVLSRFFSSSEEFRRFLIIAGVGLAIAGAGLLVCGYIANTSRRERLPAAP